MSGLFDLSGKHALVTGASSGLGRHFAGVLADAGAVVSLGARRAEALAETVRMVGPERAQALVLDVTDPAGIERGFDDAEARFGAVTVLINNAGVTATRAALDVDEKTWDQVIDTNLKGVWLTAQAAARRMVKNATGGSIVNIASILGLRVAGVFHPTRCRKPASCNSRRASLSNGRGTRFASMPWRPAISRPSSTMRSLRPTPAKLSSNAFRSAGSVWRKN